MEGNLSHIPRRWLIVSLFYLSLIALAGVLLRIIAIEPIPFLNYKFLLHSHSHVAMLGWIYGALWTVLLYCYLPEGFQKRRYNIQYWGAQFLVLGMFITFLIKGYWLASIVFSTLHIFVLYWFVWTFIRDIRRNRISGKASPAEVRDTWGYSIRFHIAALVFSIISSIGPWSLAIISARGGAGSDAYFQSIYFYLHFQYNGFFTFAFAGFLVWLLEKSDVFINKTALNLAFWLMAIAALPAYLLSLLGFNPEPLVYSIATLSGLMQLIGALILFYLFLKNWRVFLFRMNITTRILCVVALISFILKFALQFISGLPEIGVIAFTLRDVAIGYLHLVMLGMMTCGLIYFFSKENIFYYSSFISVSILIFLSGFFLNEFLLFFNSFLIWISAHVIPNYRLLLIVASLLMFLGLSAFTAYHIYKNPH